MSETPAWAVRLASERRRRGWSQKDLARRLADSGHDLGITLPGRDSILRRIKDWEAGRHRPKDPYPVLYARVFGVDEADLFALESPPITPQPEAVSGLPWIWDPDATSHAVYETTMYDLTLGRRQAVKALTVTVGPPLIDPVQRWLTLGAMPLPDRPHVGRIGTEEVTHLETATEVFRTWEHSHGGGLARKAVIEVLNEVAGVTGGRYLDLARARRDPRFARAAVTHIERAIKLRGQPYRRSMALDYAGLAHAHVITGDLDAAVAAGDTAVDAAGRVASDRVRAQLATLGRALVGRDAPGVADLRARLKSAVAG